MFPNFDERKISTISARARGVLHELRLEHALEGGLDVLDRPVDHRVEAHVHALAVREFLDALGGAHVEADDDRVVDGREVDIVLRDGADAAVNDPELDLVAHVDREQRILEGLDGTGDVTLDDEVERVDLASCEGFGEVLEADALAPLRELRGPVGRLALLGDLASRALVVGNEEGVPRARNGRQPEHHDGTRRRRRLDRLVVLVEHGANAAVGRSRDDRVADAQRARLDQDRRDRTTALVEVSLDRDASRVLVRIRAKVEPGVCRQEDRLENAR